MYFEELKTGMSVETAPAVIDKEKMMQFGLEYDNVPIHTDEEYAKTTHFGQPIAPCFMSFLAVWAKYLEVDFFGEQVLAGKSTKVEWMKPVFAGDSLTSKVTITNLVKRNEKNGIAELTNEVYNQNGEHVLTAVTEAIIKCRLKQE